MLNMQPSIIGYVDSSGRPLDVKIKIATIPEKMLLGNGHTDLVDLSGHSNTAKSTVIIEKDICNCAVRAIVYTTEN